MNNARLSVLQIDLPLAHPYRLSRGRLQFEAPDATPDKSRQTPGSRPSRPSAWASIRAARHRQRGYVAHSMKIGGDVARDIAGGRGPRNPGGHLRLPDAPGPGACPDEAALSAPVAVCQ